MATLNAIKQRLAQAKTAENAPVLALLEQQNYHAQLSAETVQKLCAELELSPVELALKCLPLAAAYAKPPVSNFYVGAVAIGQSGTFYFGANQEFVVGMPHTIHAEQSAISHCWLAGEKGVTDVVVNYTPCGHCRQFMNDLNSAEQLKIHLPNSQNNRLHDYLPNAFGPKDLAIDYALFHQPFAVETTSELTQVAQNAAQQAYAPYSQAKSGVALQLENGRVLASGYIENAAFNPSLLPFMSALNYKRLIGLEDLQIQRVVFAEQPANLSHRLITEQEVKQLANVEMEFVAL